jgi:hypothetical protein
MIFYGVGLAHPIKNHLIAGMNFAPFKKFIPRLSNARFSAGFA